MAVVDRYPTWVLLVLAVAPCGALTVAVAYVNRRSPREFRQWITLLAVYLVLVGLAWAGLLPSRDGGLITPNEGLLVLADIMLALMVVVTPVVWWQQRSRGFDRYGKYSRSGVLLGVLALVLVGASIFGEIKLASALPPPPATAACDGYGTWLLAPGNNQPPSTADLADLTQAAKEAPAGRLKQDLAMLDADVHTTIAAWGTGQGWLDYQQVISDMTTVTADCRSVPSQ